MRNSGKPFAAEAKAAASTWTKKVDKLGKKHSGNAEKRNAMSYRVHRNLWLHGTIHALEAAGVKGKAEKQGILRAMWEVEKTEGEKARIEGFSRVLGKIKAAGGDLEEFDRVFVESYSAYLEAFIKGLEK